MAKKPNSSTQTRLDLDTLRTTQGIIYSGDRPNPQLRHFIEAHLADRPFEALTDAYTVAAFDHAITSTKATKIYNMHSYHLGKKPHDAIREYVCHYTNPGDIVLDPFCGSGSTALAALLEARKAIAIDRSPAATFVAANYCTLIDPEKLLSDFEAVSRAVRPVMDWLYGTICDRCGGPATITYLIYSQRFKCPRCLATVALFDCVNADGGGKACPRCFERNIVEPISTRTEQLGAVPVAVNYLCDGKCRPKRHQRDYIHDLDRSRLMEIDEGAIPFWYPQNKMMNVEDDSVPWGAEWREGRNFRRVSDLFTKRNLWALAAIQDALLASHCSSRGTLLFALNAITLNCSKMYRYRDNLKGGYQQGTYYIPQESQMINVWRSFEDKVNDLRAAAPSLVHDGGVLVSTQSATDLHQIPANSIDYVFTDPPYGDRVQYGELNFIWESWLRLDTMWHGDEIIVNHTRGKTAVDWADGMRKAMAECLRVLKPGRWLSLCYHDTSEGTWALLQDIMSEAGFIADSSDKAIFIDTGQKSSNQLTADKVTKRDLVINFRKPSFGEVRSTGGVVEEEQGESFAARVRELIGDFLSMYPGATKDRVYDHVVSNMVRAGAMQAHNFEEHLSQVAEAVHEPIRKNLFEDKDPDLFGTHETVRWYLKSTQLDVVDAAESAKEDQAAEKLGGFIETKLAASPWLDGVHYSDLFEHFVYGLQEKPRRPMAEWLLDYFYKTESGTYRLPANGEEARIKAEGRSKGTSRRIRRYLAFLEQGIAIPPGEQQNDSTLADWIRHAKLSGMYEAGKMLFERGGLSLDRLSEEAAVNVEEDYQVCVRMLSRQEKG